MGHYLVDYCEMYPVRCKALVEADNERQACEQAATGHILDMDSEIIWDSPEGVSVEEVMNDDDVWPLGDDEQLDQTRTERAAALREGT